MLLGGAALGSPVLGQIGAGQVVPTFGWFSSLSEPVRKKSGLGAPAQQAFAYGSYNPVVSFGWFENLSEPVRIQLRLQPGAQPFLAWQPAPSPFVATGWYAPLSEPVRKRPRSPAALSPFQSWQPAPSPFVATGWYAALSEPVRVKPGLKTALQQFLASPSRLLPTPATSGVMSALETKDTFLAGAMSFNRPTDAEIAVINTTPQPAEIGLYQTGPTAGTITVRISIVIG